MSRRPSTKPRTLCSSAVILLLPLSLVLAPPVAALTSPEIGADDFRLSYMGPDNVAFFNARPRISVAFNSARREYLVAWAADDGVELTTDNVFDVYVQRVSLAGEELGVNDHRISLWWSGSATTVTSRRWRRVSKKCGVSASPLPPSSPTASSPATPRHGRRPDRRGTVRSKEARHVATSPGDLQAALERAERAALVLEEDGASAEVVMALNNVGNVHRQRGELDAARAAYDRCRRELRKSRDDWLAAMILRNLGTLEASAGALEEAATLYRGSLAHLRRQPEPWFLSRGLEELAAAESGLGRGERAARLFGAAEALRTRIGAPIVPYYRKRLEDALAATRQALTDGAFRRAWEAGARMSLDEVFQEAAGGLPDQT